ncbi:XTP/dITP diphosphatase [Capillibacterium thermochitinicola]|uniref:dITP/XTP pyrophosphatase n=1 Tax=Capillibacterium thermochitinicola TaxID=2699427 RepID=A0A8J6I0W3_9FIRM|nr:XTP/dITP diphosphatase [Capillibacterium thermochitinicola]MBA2132639.1 XTP/dITP diphosphatase [Capillibacterium thermochitinicola]
MPRLVLASRNKGKLKELKMLLAGLPWAISSLADFPEVPEVEEDGTTFRENALKKATFVAKHLQMWALADDSGLEVDYLNGAPGVYSARFAGVHGDDAKNNEKLLALLAGVPWAQRTARFRCALAFVSPEGVAWTTEGTCEGFIALAPKGEGGFGYDPLFYLPEYDRTMAELPEEEKNRISHRAVAMRQFRDYLLREFPGTGEQS